MSSTSPSHTSSDAPTSDQLSRGSIKRSVRDLSLLTAGLASLDLLVSPFQIANLGYKGGKTAVKTVAKFVRPESPKRDSTGPGKGTILFDRLRHTHGEVLDAYEHACEAAIGVEDTALELKSIYDRSEELANDDPRLSERESRITQLIAQRDTQLSGLKTTGAIFDIPSLAETSLGKSVMNEHNDRHLNELVLARADAFLSHEFATNGTIQRATKRGYRRAMSDAAGSSKRSVGPTHCDTNAKGEGDEGNAAFEFSSSKS
jgi:hypothetical protein